MLGAEPHICPGDGKDGLGKGGEVLSLAEQLPCSMAGTSYITSIPHVSAGRSGLIKV